MKVAGRSVVVTGGAGGALGKVPMPEEVAGTVIEEMEAERFLLLPHPRVGASFLRKATDYHARLGRARGLTHYKCRSDLERRRLGV